MKEGGLKISDESDIHLVDIARPMDHERIRNEIPIIEVIGAFLSYESLIVQAESFEDPSFRAMLQDKARFPVS